MKAGVVYPQTELKGDIGAVKAFAQAAESLGYDHIILYDHVLGAEHSDRDPKLAGPYTIDDPFHEPLVTFAYLAGVTEKIEQWTVESTCKQDDEGRGQEKKNEGIENVLKKYNVRSNYFQSELIW